MSSPLSSVVRPQDDLKHHEPAPEPCPECGADVVRMTFSRMLKLGRVWSPWYFDVDVCDHDTCEWWQRSGAMRKTLTRSPARRTAPLRALAAAVLGAVLVLTTPPAEAAYIYRHKGMFMGSLSVTPAPVQLTGSPLTIQIPAGNWPSADRAAFDALDGSTGNMTARMVEVNPLAGGAVIQVQVDAGPQICGQKRYLYQTHLTPGGTAGVPPVLRQFDCGTVSWVPATFTPAGPTITITAPETWVPGAAGTTSNLSL